MTFAELRQMVRREIIVDDYGDAFVDAEIDDVLWDASVQLAAAFDLPRGVVSQTVDPGATSITLTDVTNVHSLAINGDDAQSVDMQMLLRVMRAGNRPVRYFNFDRRRIGNLMIAPASVGGVAVIEVTQRLERPDALDFDAAEAWNGVLPEFHHVIAYRAAQVLFQMDERENEAQVFAQEYQTRVSELAAVLGRTDVPNLVIPAETRNDMGARG